MTARRIFLLSPAHCGGKRAAVLLNERATFPLAQRLRSSGITLGEAFSFLSGLYFRGKLAYIRAFARPPSDVTGASSGGGAWIITSDRGLVAPETPVSCDDLRRMAVVPVDVNEPRYRDPLVRDIARIANAVGPAGEVVLLGSVATGKYVDVLAATLGGRLRCPAEFVGLGDMSRGALMLRAAAAGRELAYISVPNRLSRPLVQTAATAHNRSTARRRAQSS